MRLELVRYLIEQKRFDDARDELLIAAGNDTSTPGLMEVAGMLAEAHDPADALRIYHEVAGRRPVEPQALEGTGQMAFLLGRYKTARTYLDRALKAATAAHPLEDRALAEKNLQIANAVMAIYPSAGPASKRPAAARDAGARRGTEALPGVRERIGRPQQRRRRTAALRSRTTTR